MQRWRTASVGFIASVAALCASCRNSPAQEPENSMLTAGAQKFEAIRSLASLSCMCKMAGRDNRAVELRLKSELNGLVTEEVGEASTPLAGRYRCYPQLGSNKCTAEFYFVSEPGAHTVCSRQQLEALDRTYNRAFARGDGAAAVNALTDHLNRLRSQAARTISQADCN